MGSLPVRVMGVARRIRLILPYWGRLFEGRGNRMGDLAPAKGVHEVQATVVATKEDGDNCLVLEYKGERLNPGSILTTLKFPND